MHRVLDSLHLALITHSVYFYAVINFSNLLELMIPTWYVSSWIHWLRCTHDVGYQEHFGEWQMMIATQDYADPGACPFSHKLWSL